MEDLADLGAERDPWAFCFPSTHSGRHEQQWFVQRCSRGRRSKMSVAGLGGAR